MMIIQSPQSHRKINSYLKHLIGYTDFLGVFRCDVDPTCKNGYLAEEIGDHNLLHKLVSRDPIKEWQKDLMIAYDILRDIFDSDSLYASIQNNRYVSNSHF